MSRSCFGILIAGLLLLVALPVEAADLAGLLAGARQDLEKQEYEAALAKLDQAAASEPEEPLVHFNRGNVLYRQGKYDQALAAYDRALALGGDRELLARASFNRGNAGYRLAEQLAASDPGAALARLRESEEFFRQALAAKPGLAAAARNFELTKLREQELAARQQQQQGGQGGGSQEKQAMQELAREQQELAERSRQAAESAAGAEPGADQGAGTGKNQQELKERQQQLNQRTADLGRQLEPDSEAGKAADEALAKQQEAGEQLAQQQFEAAARAQQQAAELLEKAAGNMPAGEEPEAAGEKQAGQPQPGSDAQADRAEQPSGAAQNGEAAPGDDTARRILARERQQQRSAVGPRGGLVEKDW